MNVKKALIIILIAMIFLLTGCGNDKNGGVIGKVNGEKIYQEEYDYYFGSQFQYAMEDTYTLYQTYGSIDMLDEESAQVALADFEYIAWDSVVNIALIEQLAEEYEVTIEDSYLEDVLPWAYYKSVRISLIYLDLFEAVREEMLAEVEVDEALIKEAYDEDPDQWHNRTTSHILIHCDVEDPEALAQAKAEAEAVIAKLDSGEDFAELAMEYSDDGSAAEGGVIDAMINVHGYDVVTYGSFYEEYVAEAYALNEVGDYSSEPVLSEAGYHIIKIDSIQDDYESVSDTIAQSLHTVSDEDVYYRLNDLIS